MKKLDFVKVTLIFVAVLVLVCAGATFWLNARLKTTNRDLQKTQTLLAEIGDLKRRIQDLESEKKKDLMREHENTPFGYFADLARRSGMDPNKDYETSPRNADYYEGYRDQEFNLNFKAERDRNRLGLFLVYVHSQSPRVKLVKGRMTLDEKMAERDLWKATLTFLRRDPYVGEARQ